MGNPRNNTTAPVTTNTGDFDPDSWKTMGLGSASLRNGKNLVREGDMSFVISDYNAAFLKDAAEFVLNNPTESEGKPTRISINAYPFFDTVTESMKAHFSHRLCVSAETLAKIGKKISDYVKKKAA
jgi:hypothetical protein